MKEPNSILIEQQPINNLYSNYTIDRLGSMDRKGRLGKDSARTDSYSDVHNLLFMTTLCAQQRPLKDLIADEYLNSIFYMQ